MIDSFCESTFFRQIQRTVDKVTDTGLGGVVSGMLFHEKVVKRRPKVIVWLEV